MTTEDCIDYFATNDTDGRRQLAMALGVTPPSIYSWGDYPPPLRQIQLEKMTRGKLKAEPNIFQRKIVA